MSGHKTDCFFALTYELLHTKETKHVILRFRLQRMERRKKFWKYCKHLEMEGLHMQMTVTGRDGPPFTMLPITTT